MSMGEVPEGDVTTGTGPAAGGLEPCAAPMLILVALTLVMGLLLAGLLARSGLDEASAVG
ncbi:MAG: hypothetical protein GX492_03205 [Firmicutes bacterium]|nr:hypothetical protein [Bacillota bacterium]